MTTENTSTVADRFNARSMYDIYRVVITFTERLYGGTPKNPEMIKDWVKARTGYDDAQTEVQTAEALDLIVEETATKGWTGFQGDELGLFISTNNVKAMLKQSASMLAITVKQRGSKQILAEGMEVKGLHPKGRNSRLYLGGKTQPDGFEERPIHVMTPQGKRASIKRIDYVEDLSLEFEIWVLQTAAQESRHIGEEDIVRILTFSQENGVGGDRSQGAGKFRVTGFDVKQLAKPFKRSKVEEDDGYSLNVDLGDKPSKKKAGRPKTQKFFPAES
jgi:hypothetical protein